MNPEAEQLLAGEKSLTTKFRREGEACYIDEAIVHDREALDKCISGHPQRVACLMRLALDLWTRYNQFGEAENLHEAIVLGRDTLKLCPSGNPDRSTALNNLASYIYTQYTQLGGMEDINEAIVLGREALELCLPEDPDRSSSLNNLALHLYSRHMQLGGLEDLDEAIVLAQDVLSLCPPGYPDRSTFSNNLAAYLYHRYIQYGETGALEDAIAIDRETLDLCPPGHQDRSTILNNLGLHLSALYKQGGEIDDLNEAILVTRDALSLRPPGHPDRSTSLTNLALYLWTWYSQLGEIEDLDEAIVLIREGLALFPPGHIHRSASSNNLAAFLYARHMQHDQLEDLDEAIVSDREALAARQPGHAERLTSLNNLAVHVYTRYSQLGAVEDLEEVVIHTKEALTLCPRGHAYRPVSLDNLAQSVYSRYMQLGELADLNEAIVLGREALSLCPPGHSDRSATLNNLANHIYTRYRHLGEVEDLEEAILLTRQALALRPPGHPNRYMTLNNLAMCLSSQYDLLQEIDCLDEAIVFHREALAFSGYQGRSKALHNLALHLFMRYQQQGAEEDVEELFDLLTDLQHVSQTVSLDDILAAKMWIDAAEYFHHDTILLAHKTALRLLVYYLAVLPSLPQHISLIKSIASSLAVDAFSACLRNQSPTKAVELLEQGRGVFWSQLARLQSSPVDNVVSSDPAGEALAREFRRLTSLIRSALESSEDQHDLVCHLNTELQKVVSDIRELPGLLRFLLPSYFFDLQHAASCGPVIIVNASKYSCDALVVFAERDPVHIPLSISKMEVQALSSRLRELTSFAKKSDVTRELIIFLRELWDLVVSPIADFLRTACPRGSRVWWCPTAEFSLLPLHAAAPYRNGQHGLGNHCVSSYTPTLAALIRARRPGLLDAEPRKKRFVAIGQANVPGTTELQSVSTELTGIERCIEGLATFTRVEGKESCISRVVEELGKNEWVHVACHGLPNRKQPFDSAFALHDGHFAVRRIIQCDLKDSSSEFAYLSACHTTVGDEEIHLASAMQFAGFRSVIGTMGAVDDAETHKITSVFYKHVVDAGSGCLDHTRAAYALLKTMKTVDVPLDQRILYVHIGA